MRIYNNSTYPFVKIVEIPKEEIENMDMDLCAQPKQTLIQYYNSCKRKPDILSNGGFFNMSTGQSVLNYTEDGAIISSDNENLEGIGIFNKELKFGNVKLEPFNDFISGYPVLIKEGQRANYNNSGAANLNYKARRTVLAYNQEKVFLIAVESPGLRFKEIQDILLNLNVQYAINLDGGGSTKILYNGKTLTKDWGNRPVDNVVAFYLKEKIVYRVQLGAFSTRLGANNYLKKIQSLNSSIGMDYSKAYVRKIGNHYKVQVGAFSAKGNAVKVVNDLKQLGYNSFITTK